MPRGTGIKSGPFGDILMSRERVVGRGKCLNPNCKNTVDFKVRNDGWLALRCPQVSGCGLSADATDKGSSQLFLSSMTKIWEGAESDIKTRISEIDLGPKKVKADKFVSISNEDRGKKSPLNNPNKGVDAPETTGDTAPQIERDDYYVD